MFDMAGTVNSKPNTARYSNVVPMNEGRNYRWKKIMFGACSDEKRNTSKYWEKSD